MNSEYLVRSGFLVRALYDFKSSEDSTLSFQKNFIIEVLTQLESGWWEGLCNGEQGWFPSNFVERISEDEDEDEDDLMDDYYHHQGQSDDFDAKGGQDDVTHDYGNPEKEVGWIRKDMTDGQVFYLNTRTGECWFDDANAEGDKASVNSARRAVMAQAAKEHNMIVVNKTQAAAMDDGRSGAFERQPQPDTWIVQPTEDNQSYYYVNTITNEIRWSVPENFTFSSTSPAPAVGAETDGAHRNIFHDEPGSADNDWTITAAVTRESAPVSSRRPSEVIGLRQNTLGGAGIGSAIAATPVLPEGTDGMGENNVTPLGAEERYQDTEEIDPDMAGADHAKERDTARENEADIATSNTSPPTAFESTAERPNIYANRKLPPNWIEKTTPLGRPYYYNVVTHEGSLRLERVFAESDPATSGSDGDATSESSLPVTAPSSPASSYKYSDPPTWEKLLSDITLDIQQLTLAVENDLKNKFEECASAVVKSIRFMLYTAGTVERDFTSSNPNKQYKLIKTHHRSIMGSLSKLVLCAKTAADVRQPPDALTKLHLEADKALQAVQKFAAAAQEHSLEFKRPDPVLMDNANGGSWRGRGHSPTPNGEKQVATESAASEADNPGPTATAPSLTPTIPLELIASLDELSETIYTTIAVILDHISNAVQQPRRAIFDVSVAPQLLARTREVVTKVGRFLSTIEAINMEDLEIPSATALNSFNISKQAVYNNIASLVICTQSVTNPLVARSNALEYALAAARDVQRSVKDLTLATKFLVKEDDVMEDMLQSFGDAQSGLIYGDEDIIEDNDRRNIASNLPNDVPLQPIDFLPRSSVETVIEEEEEEGKAEGSSSPAVTTSTTTASSMPSPATTLYNGVNGSETTLSSTSTGPQSAPPSTISTRSYVKPKRAQSASAASDPLAFLDEDEDDDDVASKANRATTGSLLPHKLRKLLGPEAPISLANPKLSKILGPELPTIRPLNSPSTSLPRPSRPPEERPWYLNYDYEQSEIQFNMEGDVKGATLRALVVRLTMHDQMDANFIATFLLTYRSFTTTSEFFSHLVDRFMLPQPEGLTPEEVVVWKEKKQTPVRLRVFNIIKTWLENYYQGDEDGKSLSRIKEFASTTMNEHMEFASKLLSKLVDKRLQQPYDGFRKMVQNNSPSPAPIIPKNMKKLKFLDLDPLELARQLTIMESRLYCKIRAVECLDKAWSSEDGGQTAVNIKAMILISNQVTGWVAESILGQKDIRKRCAYIKHFVAIADKCHRLNNFNSLNFIVLGLNSSIIRRLKRTWELVHARTLQLLDSLTKVVTSTKNHAEYRELLHTINPPCVPYLGLYLKDLTFIEDGNSNMLKHSQELINFSKRMRIAEVIREIQQYQSVPYYLTTVDKIQEFLKNNLESSRDINDLYEQSLETEPRETEDQKVARLIEEAGFL